MVREKKLSNEKFVTIIPGLSRVHSIYSVTSNEAHISEKGISDNFFSRLSRINLMFLTLVTIERFRLQ